MYLKHHAEACIFPPSLKTSPIQALEHVANTGGVSMPTGNISCSSPFNHFQLLDVGLCIWVPYGAGIFNQWPDKSEISLLFEGNTTDVKISPEEAYGSVCFVTYVLYVSVPK